MRRHPIASGSERVASQFYLRNRRLAVQKPKDERQHEGDDSPEDEPRLAAVGPYRSNEDARLTASAEGRDVARQIAVARVCVCPSQSETAQSRFDRSSLSAGEDVKTRTGRVEGECVRETCAFGLDLVALRALGLKLPDEIVMTI